MYRKRLKKFQNWERPHIQEHLSVWIIREKKKVLPVSRFTTIKKVGKVRPPAATSSRKKKFSHLGV